MDSISTSDTSVQTFCLPTPATSPPKHDPSLTRVGDGFTAEEVRDALKPDPPKTWQPQGDYTETEICDLVPGPQLVTFMGRVANIFDISNVQKSVRSAKGGFKLCVKDDSGAVTVRLYFAHHMPDVRLGALVSVWTSHVSNGNNGSLSSAAAPLFVTAFPERDRTCHLMVHENSDDGSMFRKPLSFRTGRQLAGLMTLQNFMDGGYDVADAKVLVVVKSVGEKKTVPGRDGSVRLRANIQVHDDTASATLGLWGTLANSPFVSAALAKDVDDAEAVSARGSWRSGVTVLLLQSPGWKLDRNLYLTTQSPTIIDVDPAISDTFWLRRWAQRQKSREAINPPFPAGVFDLDALEQAQIRALFTFAELDEFARSAPNEVFQGYLSVLLTDVRLFENFRRKMLMSGECCNITLYANATSAQCRGCDKNVDLRLNPRIIGQVMDETAQVSTGKLLFSDRAWTELLGRQPADVLKLGTEEIKYLSDRLLFCRLTLLFGWSGSDDDGAAAAAGGRICVMGVRC